MSPLVSVAAIEPLVQAIPGRRPRGEAMKALARGALAFDAFDLSWAEAHLRAAERIGTHQRDVFATRTSRLLLVWTLCLRGRLLEVHRLVDDYLRDADRHGDRLLSSALRLGQPAASRLLVRESAPIERSQATALASYGHRTPDLLRYHAVAGRAYAACARGDAAHVLAGLEEVWQDLLAGSMAEVPLALVEAQGLRASVYLGAARADAARRDELVAAAQTLMAKVAGKHPIAGPWRALVEAQAQALRNESPAAAAHADRAAAGFAEIGLGLHARVALRVRSQLLADEAGMRDADFALAALGVQKPERAVAMFAPGCVAVS